MNKKIFLVEDDLFLGKLSRKKFELAGLNVQFFDDGLEVASQVKKENPAVIVLDLVMPKKNGFQVLEEMSRLKYQIPVVVATNLGQAEDLKRVRELGAKDYFIKSEVSIKDLVNKVATIMA